MARPFFLKKIKIFLKLFFWIFIQGCKLCDTNIAFPPIDAKCMLHIQPLRNARPLRPWPFRMKISQKQIWIRLLPLVHTPSQQDDRNVMQWNFIIWREYFSYKRKHESEELRATNENKLAIGSKSFKSNRKFP